MDIVSVERRSALMSRIKGKNTNIELEVRSGLHALGFRFRLGDAYRFDGSKLPGRPDIVLPKYRVAVLIHGCFWHGHDCDLFRLPKTRTEFWRAKIDVNRKRDVRKERELLELGWDVETIWECQLRGQSAAARIEVIRSLAARIRRCALPITRP